MLSRDEDSGSSSAETDRLSQEDVTSSRDIEKLTSLEWERIKQTEN